MKAKRPPSSSRRWFGLAAWGVVVTGLVLGVACLLPWLAPRIPVGLARRGAIFFLRGYLGLYLVSLAASTIGGFFLARSLVRARRRGERGPRRAKWLALCVSVIFGSLMMEGMAWAWQVRSGRAARPELRFNEPPGPASSRDLHVVVIGESTAVGMPFEPSISIGQIVAWQLERVFPGRRVWLDVRAVGGFSLDDAVQTLSKPWQRPDAVLLYSGHNEFHDRFDVMREVPYYDDEFTIRDQATRQLRRASPLVALILGTLDEQLVDRPPAASKGRRALVDSPACTPEERDRRLSVYRSGLKAFYDYCERAGTLPILFVPASNDGNFDPNRSVLSPSTHREARDAFARAFEEARGLEAADASKSLASYLALLDEQPGFAEAHYRAGRLLAASGDFEVANRHFRLARDLDAFSIRCPSDFREACRAEGARHDGIVIDAEEVLRPLSPHGIMNGHLFLDAHHPNLVGYTALAEETLRRLRTRKAFGWPEATPSPTITPSEVASSFHLDATGWALIGRRVAGWYESVAPMRFNPSDRLALARKYAGASKAIDDGAPPETTKCPGIGVGSPTP